MLSSADSSLAAGKIHKNQFVSGSFCGMILQNHRRLPVSIFSVKIAALGSLQRVTNLLEGFSKLVSNFREAS
jgi:hypothetical protein